MWENDASGLIRISTDEDIEGNYVTSEGILQKFARKFVPCRKYLIGADPFDLEKIEKSLRWPHEVLCALDVCLWDIIGKHLKLPVYKLLGGYKEKILAYASEVVGKVGQSPKDHVRMALECLEKGYKAYKIHPPAQNWKKDIFLCKAVRDAVGNDMILLFDPYSHSHYSRRTAIKVGRAIEKLGFYWYEDPLPTTDIYGLRDLCRSLDMEVLMGEDISALGHYSELIVNQATDAIRCSGGMIGGITPMIKAAHLAEAFNMKCEPHSYGNTLEQAIHLHVMLAIRNCDFFESPVPGANCGHGMKDTIDIDLDGNIHAPRKPGLGYEINWKEIEEVSTKVTNLKNLR